jgi:putative PIN family toxin of toxin-antitoxin system
MKVILDTNIIVSAFLNPRGIPGEIVSLALSEKIILCYDNKILSEYMEVLNGSKFNFNKELVNDFLEFVKTYGDYIVAEPQEILFVDEDDKIFYDVLKSSDAQAALAAGTIISSSTRPEGTQANYIITGNKKHYPKEENILSSREFKEI